MSGRAVLYLRVSSSRQTENTSIAEQKKVLEKWCRDNGLVVDRIFEEEGESAKTADRTAFQLMFKYLSAAPKGSITHCLVHRFDRFDRDTLESAPYKLILRRLGIALRSATEMTDDTPSGRFLATILSGAAQYDNEIKAERST